MGASRHNNMLASRRRVDDESEEDGSVPAGVEEDSLSDPSPASDVDAEADADISDASDGDVTERTKRGTRNGARAGAAPMRRAEDTVEAPSSAFDATTADTEAMMNGLKISDKAPAEEVIFDDSDTPQDAPVENGQALTSSGQPESIPDRRRRDHEEYKKKRDADPSFVPNRGGFFMHDQRNSSTGQNGFRPIVRARVTRGRGGFGNQVTTSGPPQPVAAADAPWTHDLHETVAEKHLPVESTVAKPLPQNAAAARFPFPASKDPPNRSFSKSVQIGNVQMKVVLPGMREPIIFSEVPLHRHTRLPHHRPPLRRDKPVRISLPELAPKYIFPATDRSFIFIPRALRPNQQGFGRPRGRGSFSVYGGQFSGRTSAYGGGSIYSPSVAMSRRSSLAREIAREDVVSPTGSVVSRFKSGYAEPGKPVVRLPPAADPVMHARASASGSPANMPNQPLHQQPLSSEHRPATLPMHQPRPQKAITVADIDSPALIQPQQQQPPPFANQVPVTTPSQPYAFEPGMFTTPRRPSYHSQRGTPLSQIPERAIHAQPFNPYAYQQPPAFYPQQYPPTMYYYAAPGAMPPQPSPLVPNQHYAYMVPAMAPPAPPEATTQPGTVAHESNGTVYYYDSSQLANAADPSSTYPPMAFPGQNGYMVPTMYYPNQ